MGVNGVRDLKVLVQAGAIKDIQGNSVRVREAADGAPVTSFVSDSQPPVLKKFHINLDSDLLTLQFDETVDRSTFDVRGVSLDSTLGTIVTLTNASTVVEPLIDSSIVRISLGFDDINK